MNKVIQALWYLGLIVVSIVSAKSLYGIVEVPRFRSSFKNKIAKYELAVVHFVNYDILSQEEMEDQEFATKKSRLDDMKKPSVEEVASKMSAADIEGMTKHGMTMDNMGMDKKEMPDPSHADYMLDMLEDMKESFRAAADSTRYERANIGFIGVDLTQIPHLIEEYDLYDVSTLMLFKDGVPFKVKGKVVKTNALLTSRSKVKDFINAHFDTIIADILEDLAEQERQRPQTRVTRVYSYPRRVYRTYPRHYGYGDPSWGGYWRGGYGWRYPYWRRYGYWGRPYGGFGFGFGGRRGGFGIGFGW